MIGKYILWLSCLFIGFPLFGQTMFEKQVVIDDLRTLYKNLEQTHFDLFAYTPKAHFDMAIQNEIKGLEKEAYTQFEVWNLYQRFTALAKKRAYFCGFSSSGVFIYIWRTEAPYFRWNLPLKRGKCWCERIGLAI